MPPAHLVSRYDLVIFDLDGVVILGDRPVPGAVEAIIRLHQGGHRLAYATNNASRRAAEVADLLRRLGIEAAESEVLTSAQAAAAVLAQRLPAGSPVLVVGADALRADVREEGLRAVGSADDGPAAVVQGYGPEVGWAALAEATVAIRAGAAWVATNTDRTLPTPRGPLPGNGSLVAALRTALDRDPDVVVGKPEPTLFETAARRVGARRPIAVGDRLDTDIAGADRSGLDSLLVLTGVTRPWDLLAAPPDRRPTYVATDLSGLFDMDEIARVPRLVDGSDRAAAGGWRVIRRETCLELIGPDAAATGTADTAASAPDALPALRLLSAVAWAGAPVEKVTAGSAMAADVLRELGLD